MRPTRAIALLLLAACAPGGPTPEAPPPMLPPGVEAFSLLGDTLRPPPLSDAARARLTAQLDSAQRAVAADSGDPDARIWLGRRTAYLGRYHEAIAIFSNGIRRFPNDARFYRHRGHRWISVRAFDRAMSDLTRAADLMRRQPDAIEPDGLPNARNTPTSTLQSNVWYHLGLAHWLRGDVSAALAAWQQCLRVSTNPDMDVATRYWLYLAQRRLGNVPAAAALLEPVRRDQDIIENGSYHRLLLVFKGVLPVDSVRQDEGQGGATTAYGLAAWLDAEGNHSQSEYFLRRARSGGQWAAFGYIAAEADLARMARGR